MKASDWKFGLKLVLAITLALMVAWGCAETPVETSNSSNAHVNVDLLFEHDGARVYRFYDAGHYVYYVTPVGQAMRPAEVRSTGKGVVRIPAIQSTTIGEARP